MRKYLFSIFMLAALPSFAVWDVTTPAGTEAKSLGDDRIREFKTDVQTSLQFEGDFPGTDTSNPRFIYTPSTGTTGLRPTGNDAPTGRLFINIASSTLEMSQGNGTWAALDVVGSSTVTPVKLTSTVAGDGILGGNGTPLSVGVDPTTFQITGDSVTIIANSIGSTQIADSVTIPTLAVTTATWQGFGILPILQVQSATTSSESQTTGTSYTDSNLTVSITPKLSTSKIFVMVSGTGRQGNGSDGYITLARNGTNLGDATGGFVGMVSNNNYQVGFNYLDSPATTSALTYTVRIRNGAGAIQTIFPASTASASHVATIIAIEIGQ